MFRFATLVCFVLGITAVPTTAAVITWTATAGGSWHTPSNWDLNRVPTAGDDVVIPDMSPDINVTHSTGSTSINSLTSAESFTLSGGTLDIAAASTLNSVFALSGGTLSGSGDVTVNGAMSWTNNPSMSGSGKTIITSTGSLSISDSGQKFLARVLENHSANVTWSDADIAFGGGTLNNAADGTINVTGAASRGFTNSGGTNAVNNAGTFNKSGTATLTAQFNIPFSNTGTVNLDAGTLTLSGGGTNSTQIDADAGTTLTFSTSYTHGGASSLTGQGTLTFSGGTHTITGTLDTNRIININATVNFNAPYTFPGTVNLSGGALGGSGDATITGTLNWTNNPTMSGSGRTIIASTGSLSISDSGQKFLARVLENHSANVTWSDGDIAFGGGTLNNASDGTINITGAANRFFSNSGGTNVVNNAGTINKSGAGTLTAGAFGVVTFNNTGIVNLDAGGLTLAGGGTNSTQIDADAGTTLTFSTSYTHGGASSLTGQGTLTFSGGTHTITGTLHTNRIINIGAGSTVNFNAPYTFAGTVNLTSAMGGSGDATITGTLNWTAIEFGSYGQMLGAGKTTITAAAILNITGVNHVLGRVLESHSANVTWSGGDIVFAGGTWNNAFDGTINITGAANRVCDNGGGTNAVNNAGTFNKSGAATVTAQSGVPFNNTGMINILSGTLTANNTYVQTAGATILNGGSLIKTGTALALQGGQLKGNGTLTGDVINSGGTVAPGLSPGGLIISGNYTQQSGGTLAIEIGGPIPDLEFDVLSVSGTATLNGTLLATLTFGFDPVCGNTFQFLTAGTVSGTFQTLSAPDAGLTIEAQYAATSATIRALGGDMNCDDLINGLDVQAFVTALINPAGYQMLYPACDILNADFTLDTTTSTADIPAFVQHLLNGVCP